MAFGATAALHIKWLLVSVAHLLCIRLCQAEESSSCLSPLLSISPGAVVVQDEQGTRMPGLGFGTAFWVDDDKEEEGFRWHTCGKCFVDAIDAGFRHFDLAELYTGSEVAFGDAWRLRPNVPREEFYIVSKAMPKAEEEEEEEEVYTHEGVLHSFNHSVQALNVSYLDAYLLHWPETGWEEAWRAMEDLYIEGRVRAVGLSNFNKARIEKLLSLPKLRVRPSLVQNFFDPRHQWPQLRRWCAREGIAFVGYSALTHFASAKMRATYGKARAVLEKIAAGHGVTPHKVILRWGLQEGVVMIPKSRKLGRMQQNLAALNLRLTKEDMAQIRALDAPEDKTLPDDSCHWDDDLITC